MSFVDTKIDVKNDQQTADILSVSALIAYELQRTPTANYAFDMQNIIDVRFSWNSKLQKCEMNNIIELIKINIIYDRMPRRVEKTFKSPIVVCAI